MKSIVNKNDLIVYIYKNEIDCDVLSKENLEIYIKKIILKIKKKYLRNISGFYTVNVFLNEKYGMILDIIKDDELDFFPDLLDLKVVVFYNSDIYLEYDDYFVISSKKVYYYDKKYYVNINDLGNLELLKISEFSRIIYGNMLKKIVDNFILVGV